MDKTASVSRSQQNTLHLLKQEESLQDPVLVDKDVHQKRSVPPPFWLGRQACFYSVVIQLLYLGKVLCGETVTHGWPKAE